MSDSEDERHSKDELSSFLAKVDQIEELVKGLVTSGDPSSSSEALEKADKYLQQSSTNVVKETTSTQDRMVVNKTTVEERGVSANQDAFLQTLEQDAKERAARRKEREARGKQAKREGSKKFRNGDFEGALVHFTEAIRETPWDITLYTNRALTYNRLSRYPEAIEDCDKALKFEPATLKAYVHKGNALRKMQQLNKAEECFNKALQLFPENRKDIDIYLKELKEASSHLLP